MLPPQPDLWISLSLFVCALLHHAHAFGWLHIGPSNLFHSPQPQINPNLHAVKENAAQKQMMYQFWRRKKVLKENPGSPNNKPHLKRFFHYSPYIRLGSGKDRLKQGTPKQRIKHKDVYSLTTTAAASTTKEQKFVLDTTSPSVVQYSVLVDKNYQKPWMSEINTFDRRPYRISVDVPETSESSEYPTSTLQFREPSETDHGKHLHNFHSRKQGRQENSNSAEKIMNEGFTDDYTNSIFRQVQTGSVAEGGHSKSSEGKEDGGEGTNERKYNAGTSNHILSLLKNISSMVENLVSNYRDKNQRSGSDSSLKDDPEYKNGDLEVHGNSLETKDNTGFPTGILFASDTKNEPKVTNDVRQIVPSLGPDYTPTQAPRGQPSVGDPSLPSPSVDDFSTLMEQNPVLQKHANSPFIDGSFHSRKILDPLPPIELPPLGQPVDYEDTLITEPFLDNEPLTDGYFVPHYDSYSGYFDDDQSGCEGIESRTCAHTSECSCFGLYFCIQERCAMLPAIPGDGMDPEFEGTWMDSPVDGL